MTQNFVSKIFTFSPHFCLLHLSPIIITKRIKVFGVQLKVIPMAFTVLNECFIFSCDLKSILGGGCGKNGSTVAVSRARCLLSAVSLVVVSTFLI